MLRRILVFGLIAGLVEGIPLFSMTLWLPNHSLTLVEEMAIGYTVMLISLSTVFIAIKRRRDEDLGGIIGFWQALLLGLAISFIASLFYVAAWEAAVDIGHIDFAGGYARQVIAEQKAKGISAEALAKLIAEMNAFKAEYANPFYRLSEAFSEMFPVGVLVSLISAGLLCNHRFLPVRRS